MTLSDVGAIKKYLFADPIAILFNLFAQRCSTGDDDMDPLVVIPNNHANERLSSYVQNKSFWDPDVMSGSLQSIRFAPQKAQCYWRKIEGIEGMDEINDLIEYPKIVNSLKLPTKQCQTLSPNSCLNSKPFLLLFVASFVVSLI